MSVSGLRVRPVGLHDAPAPIDQDIDFGAIPARIRHRCPQSQVGVLAGDICDLMLHGLHGPHDHIEDQRGDRDEQDEDDEEEHEDDGEEEDDEDE